MKKVMLLVFATLTLVSCGANSLNPEKMELKKLPLVGIPLTVIDNDTVNLNNIGGPVGNKITKVDVTYFTDALILPVKASVVMYTTPANVMSKMVKDIPISFDLIATTDPAPALDTYTITFSDIPANATITRAIIPFRKILTTKPINFDLLSVSAPTFSGVITTTIPEPLKVSGYTVRDYAANPPMVVPSRIAYIASAAAKTEIFDAVNATSTYQINEDGTIDIPAAANEDDPSYGLQYKIWILERYQP